MATLDDSPSQYPGISWTAWAEIAELNHKDDPGEKEPPPDVKVDSDSMKLKRQEMALYGLCPARDEVFLVVCEKCNQVVKPQALQRHMEIRHNQTSPSKGKRSSSSSASSTPTKCKSSRSSSSRHRNHTNPVVKVERMSSDVVRQKLSKKTALGYDTERPRPPEKPGISLDSEEVKQLLAITPDDPMPTSSTTSSTLISINDFSKSKSHSASKTEVITLEDEKELPKRVPTPEVIKEETITLGNILDAVPYTSSSSSSSGYQDVAFNPMHQVTFDALKDIFEPSSIKQEQHSGASSKAASPASVPPAAPPTPPSSVESKPQEITLKLDSRNNDQFIKLEPTPSPSSQYKVEVTSNNNLTSTLKSISSTSSIVSMATPSMLTVTSSVTLTTIAASPVTTATTLVVSCLSTSPATSVLTTSSSSSSSATAIRTPTTASTSSSAHMKTKDPRFLPCKDRIYDAEKHCGVWIEESQRHCTRSLTCKTHALSLRRNVTGRSKSFDQLLQDHRAAKEAALKAKQEAVAAAVSRTAPSPGSSPAAPATPTSISPAPPTPTFRPLHSTSGMVSGKLFKTSAALQPSSSTSATAAKLTSQLHKPSVPPVFVDHGNEGVPLPECPQSSSSRVSSDGEDGDDNDPHVPTYINHHPRPAAVNGFGGWLHGAGCYKFHRREDLMRSAFAAAVERHLHPPPHKKLCVESKLSNSAQAIGMMQPQGPDPYDFVVTSSSDNPPLPPNTLANAAARQAANTALALANKAAAKSLAKPKAPPSSLSAVNIQHRSLKLNSAPPTVRSGLSSTSGVVTSNAKIGALTAAASMAALQPVTVSAANTSGSKRKRSGSSGSSSSNHHHHQHHHQQQQHLTPQQQPISIAIPAGPFNANLSAAAKVTHNAQGKFQNSNLLNCSDLNLVISDSGSSINNNSNASSTAGAATGVMNGQLVSIPGVTHHIHLNALAPLDKNAKGKGAIRGFPAPGRGPVPVTALNSTASSLMGGNTAALLEQQRGGGLTLTMVTSASIFTNNPSSTGSSSSVGATSTAAVSGAALLPPNGVLTNAQTLGQLKGFPISINHLPGLQPARTTDGKQANQQGNKQSGSRSASNGASGSKAAGIRGGVPLSAQQLAAAIQLGGAGPPRFMPPQLATATLAPIHLQPQQQQNSANKKLNSKQQQHHHHHHQQQPVSLTIVTPASGAVGTHQTLLLQPQPAAPPPPPPQAPTQTAAPTPEPHILS